MADRTSMFIEFGGRLKRSLVADLVEIAESERMGLDYDGPWLEEADLNSPGSAIRLFGNEIAGGTADELEAFLRKHGLPYRKQWDAHYAFAAGGEYFDGEHLHSYAAEGTSGIPHLSTAEIVGLGCWEEVQSRVALLTTPIPDLVIIKDQPPAAPVHEYLFDVKLFAAIRIRAPDEDTARRQLAEVLNCADLSVCHGGVDMPDTFEASMDGEADLGEVDGEAV